MTDRQRNETEQALHLLGRVLALNSQHREALNLMHWLQAQTKKKSDEVVVAAVDGLLANHGRPFPSINHYRNSAAAVESSSSAAIGSLPSAAVHHPPPTTATSPAALPPSAAGHWITANRLQPTQREESRQQQQQHRSGTTSSSNYRWNKTAKNWFTKFPPEFDVWWYRRRLRIELANSSSTQTTSHIWTRMNVCCYWLSSSRVVSHVQVSNGRPSIMKRIVTVGQCENI